MIGFWAVIVVCYCVALYLCVQVMIHASLGAGVALYLVALLALFPMPTGFHIVAIAQLRGRPWTFSDFFGGFRFYLTLLGNAFLLGLILAGALIPLALVLAIFTAISQEAARVVGVPLVNGVLFCFTLWLSAFAQQLIVDNGEGAMEALNSSWQISRGQRL